MDLRDAALTLALVEAADRLTDVARHDVADIDILEQLGGPGAVTAAELSGLEDLDRPKLEKIRRELDASAIDRLEHELNQLREIAPDAWLATVCDSTYPHNLQLIYNRPPFLFARGELLEEDARSMPCPSTAERDTEIRRRPTLAAGPSNSTIAPSSSSARPSACSSKVVEFSDLAKDAITVAVALASRPANTAVCTAHSAR